MTLISDAKKIYDDSVKLYKKSILLYRHAKGTHRHHKKIKTHHPKYCYDLFKARRDYERLLKNLSKHIKKLKHLVKK